MKELKKYCQGYSNKYIHTHYAKRNIPSGYYTPFALLPLGTKITKWHNKMAALSIWRLIFSDYF